MLPKIAFPEYDLELNNGTKIRYRPYLVKEEKVLLMAMESGEEKEMSSAIRQIVNSCVTSPEEFDCLELPAFEVDYIYMSLRSASVGGSIETEFVANNCKLNDGNPCQEPFSYTINDNDIKLHKEDLQDTIHFTKDVGVIMQYTPYKATLSINEDDDTFTRTLKIIHASIKQIFDAENTYSMKETSLEELNEWLEGLTNAQYQKITDYIENAPYYEIEIKHHCEKCGETKEMRFSDIVNFF